MATHSSILACEVQWTEEPGGLQSMGSLRVRHNLRTKQQQVLAYTFKIFQRPSEAWENTAFTIDYYLILL